MANDAYDNAETDKAILRQLGAKAERGQAQREQHIEVAAGILAHYFQKANEGVRLDILDLHAELYAAVEHIVDAATPIPPVQPAFVKLQPGEQDERD